MSGMGPAVTVTRKEPSVCSADAVTLQVTLCVGQPLPTSSTALQVGVIRAVFSARRPIATFEQLNFTATDTVGLKYWPVQTSSLDTWLQVEWVTMYPPPPVWVSFTAPLVAVWNVVVQRGSAALTVQPVVWLN